MDADGAVVKGERIASRNVLWTAGVVATPIGRWLGAPTDKIGRVMVRPDLSSRTTQTSSLSATPRTWSRTAIPCPASPLSRCSRESSWELIRDRPWRHPSRRPSFHYRDKGNLATIGRGYAILDLGWLKLSGFPAWVLWIFIHIWYLIGFRNRLSVLLQWAWAYFTYARVARIIYAERTPAGAGDFRRKPS